MKAFARALADLPLFSHLDEGDVETLLGVFEQKELKKGETLFEAGAPAEALYFLMSGTVSLRREDEQVLLAHSPAPLGELGALTGEDRNLSAVADSDIVVLQAPTKALQDLFEANGRLGYHFQANLLHMAARKIARDRKRLAEMRQNIVSTQKAMKTMRDAILQSEDTPLHALFYEEFDALIEQNRRIHYLVEPSLLVPTAIQLEGGEVRRVTAISNEWIHFANPPKSLEEGKSTMAILLLDGEPLPVTGNVERVSSEEGTIFLDELVEPLEQQLTKHLTRAQMLDVVL